MASVSAYITRPKAIRARGAVEGEVGSSGSPWAGRMWWVALVWSPGVGRVRRLGWVPLRG